MQPTPISPKTRLDCLKTAVRGTFPCNRIVATEKWLGHVSHEVKNPLTIVLSNAALIRRFSNDERVNKLADAIVTGSRQMERILNDLLDVARVQSGNFTVEKKRVDAQTLVGSVLNAESVMARGPVELRGSATGTVLCDPTRITQVLINLVSNALKFTKEGSVEIHGEDLGETYRFKVSDTGRGMKPEEVERIFDQFWQADTPEKMRGSGLGMTISRSIVESHCGNIWVESVPGQGTTISFELPQN